MEVQAGPIRPGHSKEPPEGGEVIPWTLRPGHREEHLLVDVDVDFELVEVP